MLESIRNSRRRLDRRVTASSVLALMLAIAPGARAALPPSFVAASIDGNSSVLGPFVHDSGALALPQISQTWSDSATSANGASASGSGFASADEFGTLKVSVNDSVTSVSNNTTSLTVGAIADRGDTFHILPTTGATYSFLATLEWSGPSVAQCPVGSQCTVNVINHLLKDGFVAMDNSAFYDSSDPKHPALPGTQNIQQVWTFTGPSSFQLDWALDLGASVYSSDGVSASFAADLSHTGHFYLDPISPGASYTTASGNLYLSPTTAPVPEPTTTALMLIAMPALVFAIKRRTPAR